MMMPDLAMRNKRNKFHDNAVLPYLLAPGPLMHTISPMRRASLSAGMPRLAPRHRDMRRRAEHGRLRPFLDR